MATKKSIKPSEKVRVYKNIVGSLSYRLRGIFVFWEETVEYKDMQIADIEEMLGHADLYRIFDKNKLLIKDEEIREYLKLEPLDDEYLDSKKIKELLNDGDSKKLEEVVETCEDSELELIVDTAVKERVKDRNVLGVLEDYTGLDLTEDILNNVENVEKSDKSDKTIKRTKKK